MHLNTFLRKCIEIAMKSCNSWLSSIASVMWKRWLDFVISFHFEIYVFSWVNKKNISTDFSIWPIHKTFWAYLNRKSSCLADCRNEKLFLFASTHMYKYIISANTNIQHVTTSHDTFKELTYKKKSNLWSINISRFMYDLAMFFFLRMVFARRENFAQLALILSTISTE